MKAQTLGRTGEDYATRYLECLGWTILHRNWRCSSGEIDIIARDGDTLVFVEVKTRIASWAGHPLEAITPIKLRTLRTLGLRFLAEVDEWYPQFRFDAIGILWSARQPDLQHVRDVR